jgi:hypothetical protein
MLPRLSAVIQDVKVRATGFFEGIGQDRHSLEGTLVVDGLGYLRDRAEARVPSQPGSPRIVSWYSGISFSMSGTEFFFGAIFGFPPRSTIERPSRCVCGKKGPPDRRARRVAPDGA